jgi:WD and tetratricopeptide repeat-containing protein 1
VTGIVPLARLSAASWVLRHRGASPQVVATYHGDHAYCFDVTGAAPAHGGGSSAAAEAGGREHGPLDLFAGAAAAAALASSNGARARRGRGSSVGSGGGASGSGGGGGGMADLPGMLPAAAERAKADGNLALFSRQYYEAVQRYSEAIRLAPWAPILYTNRCAADGRAAASWVQLLGACGATVPGQLAARVARLDCAAHR